MSTIGSITLKQILDLVGKLDDSVGEETSRERFRRFLKENVKNTAQIRDYYQECIRNTGTEYYRALQDLTNRIGEFLGFEVTYGRYVGVPGKVGFDGLWKSPSGYNIVVEVKTTEAYAIKTATLEGYINDLISEKIISDRGNALGIYVVGRPDPEINQLENSIIAEKRTHQLRIAEVESLLSLAEMMNEYNINHDDILSIPKPSGPKVDPIIYLMSQIIAQTKSVEVPLEKSKTEEVLPKLEEEGESKYWLTATQSDEMQTGEQIIQELIEKGIYAFSEKTPRKKDLKSGDWIAFYASGNGVVAHAKVLSKPENKPNPKIRKANLYPWTFTVGDAKIYIDNPVIIDNELRSKLNAFKDAKLDRPWGWFVISTREVSKHDFDLLTRKDNN